MPAISGVSGLREKCDAVRGRDAKRRDESAAKIDDGGCREPHKNSSFDGIGLTKSAIVRPDIANCQRFFSGFLPFKRVKPSRGAIKRELPESLWVNDSPKRQVELEEIFFHHRGTEITQSFTEKNSVVLCVISVPLW
jgi:hypothetical protein